MKRLTLPELFVLLLSAACVSILLLAAACTDSTQPLEPDGLNPYFDVAVGTITQITMDPADQQQPAISGDRIVWEDFRNGDWDIYMYDLATGTETQITTDPASQYGPAISGDRIVWVDRRNGNRDIYMYDLTSGTESQITTDPAEQELPKISGDRIVWIEGPGRDLNMFDLATGTQTTVAADPESHFLVHNDISGDRIVWAQKDDVPDNYEIRMYDLATGTETQIITDPIYDHTNSAISGNRIVWLRSGFTPYVIYMLDLATGTQTPVASRYTPADNLDFSGDRIVWEDNGYGDIFVLDLATGTETQIAEPGNQDHPAIFGDRIVWEDDRNGNGDIYMFEPGVVQPPSLQDLSDLVDQYEAAGSITNHGTAESLHAFIRQIGSDLGTGDLDAACARFDHFISAVANKSGKQIEAVVAQTLIDLAQALKDEYGCSS